MVVYQEKDVFRHALCIASVCGAGYENPGKALCPPEPSFFMRRERSLSAKGVGVAESTERRGHASHQFLEKRLVS